MSVETIYFKDFLPDLPELNNPGLTDARNVVPYDGRYFSYQKMSDGAILGTTIGPLPGRPVGALQSGSGAYIYAGSPTRLYRQLSALGTWSDVSAATYNASTTNWDWLQFDDSVIATNYWDSPQHQTLGSGSAFTALSLTDPAPRAARVAQVGRFVVLGNTNETANGAVSHRIQWSAIDNPRNWPIPNSSTAVATQSGEQFLESKFGPVNGIAAGDQYGLVLQLSGLTRMTYVGGNVVFQFDRISDQFGLYFPFSLIAVGGRNYYISDAGIMVTDGVQIERIGQGKVDRFIQSKFLGSSDRVFACYDQIRNLIFWCARSDPVFGTGEPDFVLVYNPMEGRFTYGDQACECLFQGKGGSVSNARGFLSGYTLGRISSSGTVGSGSILTTGEAEWTPGAYTRVSGVKPLIAASNTLGASVALGTRNDQETSPSYTSETSVNSRSGFADFRTEARYIRARMTITRTFNSAQGLEVLAKPSGGV